MPIRIHELGVDPTEEQILEMARKCSRDGSRTVGGIRPLDEADMAAVYRMAL